jgi:hypothetical protein
LQTKNEERVAGRDRYVLPAVYRKADRVGRYWAPGLKIPKWFAGRRIKRIEVPFV